MDRILPVIPESHPSHKVGKPYFQYRILALGNVYDGDTLTLLIDLGFRLQKNLRVRIVGVNTPEVNGQEKNAGIIVRDAVRTELQEAWAFSTLLYYSSTDADKYGRALGDVWLGDTWLSAWLIDMRMAIPYSGGTKDKDAMIELVASLKKTKK